MLARVEHPIDGFLQDLIKTVEAGEYDFKNCATALDPVGPYYKEDVVAAILETGGVWSDMAKLLRRRRANVKAWVEGHWDVLEFFYELRDGNLDRLEYNMMKAGLAGDTAAAKFLLTTLGKDRGFSTRSELTGADGKPIAINNSQFDLENMTDEQLAAYELLTSGIPGPSPEGGDTPGNQQTCLPKGIN